MTPEPNSFLGEYRYTIDEKGRVNVPAPFRKVLHPANNRTFVISKSIAKDKCLVAMPFEDWSIFEDDLTKKLLRMNPIDQKWLRDLTRYATICRYDSQGRITIPKSLLEVAGLSNEAVIIGMLKQIEIWDPGELEKKSSEEEQLTEEQLAALAEKIVL